MTFRSNLGSTSRHDCIHPKLRAASISTNAKLVSLVPCQTFLDLFEDKKTSICEVVLLETVWIRKSPFEVLTFEELIHAHASRISGFHVTTLTHAQKNLAIDYLWPLNVSCSDAVGIFSPFALIKQSVLIEQKLLQLYLNRVVRTAISFVDL